MLYAAALLGFGTSRQPPLDGRLRQGPAAARLRSHLLLLLWLPLPFSPPALSPTEVVAPGPPLQVVLLLLAAAAQAVAPDAAVAAASRWAEA